MMSIILCNNELFVAVGWTLAVHQVFTGNTTGMLLRLLLFFTGMACGRWLLVLCIARVGKHARVPLLAQEKQGSCVGGIGRSASSLIVRLVAQPLHGQRLQVCHARILQPMRNECGWRACVGVVLPDA